MDRSRTVRQTVVGFWWMLQSRSQITFLLWLFSLIKADEAQRLQRPCVSQRAHHCDTKGWWEIKRRVGTRWTRACLTTTGTQGKSYMTPKNWITTLVFLEHRLWSEKVRRGKRKPYCSCLILQSSSSILQFTSGKNVCPHICTESPYSTLCYMSAITKYSLHP